MTMDPAEASRLRALYRSLPTERLAFAVLKESRDYEPEAMALLLEELRVRGVAEKDLPTVLASMPPPRKPHETWFRPASLNRMQYVVRWLIWAVSLITIGLIGISFSKNSEILFLGPIVVGVVYKIVCMDMPRLRNAGLSPWLLFLMVIPIVNLFFLAVLFFAPPEAATPSRLPK
jgi:hypothetical protein